MGKFLVLFLLFFNVCFSSHAQIYTDGWNDSKIEFVSHSASENVNVYSEVPIESKKAEKLDDSLAVKIQDLSARIESLEKRKQ